MLKKGLLIPVFLGLLLVSSIAGVPVLAQDGDGVAPVFCGTLTEADCQLLTDSQQASASLTSATFDVDGGLTVSHIPGMPFDSLEFKLNGSGSYAVDPEVIASLKDIQGNTAEFFSHPEQIGQLYESLLGGVAGDLTLTLILPVEIKAFSTPTNPIPDELSIGLRLVDGIGYVNLDALAEQVPEAKIPGGWYGLEVAKLSGTLFQQLFAQIGDTGTIPSFDFKNLSQFSSPDFLSKFATMERLADDNGEAVFQMTFDYAALFSGDEFRDLMKSQMSMYGDAMKEADLDQIMDMVQQMYDGLDMKITTRIGLEDHYIYGGSLALNWDMTSLMETMNNLNSSDSGGSSTPQTAPVLEFEIGITYDNFNAAPEIEVPDAVDVLKAEDAIKLFGMTLPRNA
ncbi:MAG TPA: hypothetical protein VHL11_25670 [Phototrophicaceae bacterium]|jgi:hypothetical protein|nr:hypothetical protein [Phototrophicaceae bacterium]